MDQHCLSCGRDTAAGTRLFSARKRGRDTELGTAGYLCHACQVASATIQTIPVSGRFAVNDFPGGYPS